MIQALFDLLKSRLSGVDMQLGPERVSEHGQPPRIVMMPSPGSDLFTGPLQKEKNRRSIRTRVAALEAHLWGKDYEAIEQEPNGLLHRFISALHAEVGGSHAMMPGSGYQDTREAGAQMNQGRLYILVFSVETPVIEVRQTAPITTVTNTSDLT